MSQHAYDECDHSNVVSTMAEHFPRHVKVEGSSPGTITVAGREKMAQTIQKDLQQSVACTIKFYDRNLQS